MQLEKGMKMLLEEVFEAPIAAKTDGDQSASTYFDDNPSESHDCSSFYQQNNRTRCHYYDHREHCSSQGHGRGLNKRADYSLLPLVVPSKNPTLEPFPMSMPCR